MLDSVDVLAERLVWIFPAHGSAGDFLPFAQVFKQLMEQGLDAAQSADAIEAAHELGWVFFSAWKATVTLAPSGVNMRRIQNTNHSHEAYLIAAE